MCQIVIINYFSDNMKVMEDLTQQLQSFCVLVESMKYVIAIAQSLANKVHLSVLVELLQK